MAERIVINYMVDTLTKTRIEKIGEITKRPQGYVVDWAIEQIWNQMAGESTVRPCEEIQKVGE